MSGYVYRGKKREGLPDLETANAAIMTARAELGFGDRRRPVSRYVTGAAACCRNGHAYTNENTRISADGTRRCPGPARPRGNKHERKPQHEGSC